MKLFEDLSQNEKNLLLKYPAYISLLAANAHGEFDETEKKVSTELTHIKTFSCEPLLCPYYKEVEKEFEKNIRELDDKLPKDKAKREAAIRHELTKLESILHMLDNDFVTAMHKSLNSYIKHVSKAHNNVLEYFLLPFNIKDF